MSSRLQLALRNAIGEAVLAACSIDGYSGGADPCDEIFLRLVHDAETGNLPNDPRDWFRQQLEYELPNSGQQAAAKRRLLERSEQLVAVARIGPADVAAMLSRAGAPEPANATDTAQLAARCLTAAMSHQRSMAIAAGWEPYKKLLREAREAQHNLRQIMPALNCTV